MSKVVMQSNVSVAANTTVPNVASGMRYERSPFPAIGALYCAGSAAGLTLELNVGGRSISPPTVVNAQNRLPVVPDDLLIPDFECDQGELIQITVVNTTAGALTINWRLELEEAEFQG